MDENDGLSLRPGDAEMAARIAWLATRRPIHFRPWENIRPDGCCLSDAILELTLPSFRPNVQELLADEEIGFRERSAVLRDYLWRHLLWRLQQEHLFVRGLVFATGEDWRSEPRMFDDAEPDFARNRITCFGRTFASVRVYETPLTSAEHQQAEKGAAAPQPERRTRAPLAASDMKLFPEWERLLANGMGAWPAAAKLAPKAEGGGTEGSKTKRLYDRFTQLKSSTQN